MKFRTQAIAAIALPILLAAPLPAADFHQGRTQLTAEERGLLLQVKPGQGPFERLWVAPGFDGTWGLLKWDPEHSWAVPEAPGDLLDQIREAVGEINQEPCKGADLRLSVTVYHFKRQGFLSKPEGHFELVARNRQGKAVWIAQDRVKRTQPPAIIRSDTDSQIMARELQRKIRVSFRK